MDDPDIIIIGSGSAGSALAGRLGESGRLRVLVLEAGPSDRSIWIRMPIGYGKCFYDPRVNWMYRTDPVPGLADRSIYQPRGKVVGGSSSINAMVYARGQPEDFDGWAALGNPGWAWRDLLPLYRRMEHHALGASAWHGAAGPLAVTDISKTVHPLTHRFVEAGIEAGLPFNPDLNGADSEGVGYYQITTRSGWRESAASAYLRPALKTGRVRLVTGAHVTRLLFEGHRAVGVEYRRNGRLVRVAAKREIVLAAGAINSPQVLQLSGVGPADLLRRHGIGVVVDNPAVGGNLQDHLAYDLVYRSRVPSLNDVLLPWSGRLRVALSYALTRRGPLSLSVNQGGGFFRSRPDIDRPDTQLYFSPLSYERAVPGVRALMLPDAFSGFTLSASPCRPQSRGRVDIGSADPDEPPTIAPNYLAAEADVRVLLDGARFLRRLADTPTFAALIAEELKPGPTSIGDEALIADIRQRAYSVFHPCGTCAMGPEATNAVVDARLRVHGLSGLRVADAAIFPTVTSGNTNAPSMLVGEKAADLILADLA